MSALSRPWIAMVLLGGAFAAYTVAVAAGLTRTPDLQVARAMAAIWRPAPGVVAAGFAELGGPELTFGLALAMALGLVRAGCRGQAWALLALPVAVGMEVAIKLLVHHPAPSLSHPDGPGLITVLAPGALSSGGSYPSGHMLRTVIVYGVGSVLVRRLAVPGWVRGAAYPSVVALVVLMALDRLYLGVHWQSDVVGGVLLGSLALAGARAWLERPRAAVS